MPKLFQLLFFSLLIGFAGIASANNNPSPLWSDLQTRSTEQEKSGQYKQRTLQLDEDTFHAELARFEQQGQEMTLALPLPEGGFADVRLIPVDLLAPEVAAQHRNMRTWRVKALAADSPITSGRAELTTLGFHVMLMTEDGDTLFIQPQKESQTTSRSYRSVSKRSLKDSSQHAHTHPHHHRHPSRFIPEEHAHSHTHNTQQRVLAARAGEQLHTYDIAVAARADFTAYHNGSRADALSAIVTTLNRVNEIYQRDLSIQLRLVSGTEIIFDNANTDPYSATSDLFELLDVNQTVIDREVGNRQYDIGHLFMRSSGGIAVVGSLCRNNFKAQGISGWTFPEGEFFAIGYVAHEIGHQLGATHTFNGVEGSCAGANRIADTAYEPGSGSTIMAYAGLCVSRNADDNLQNRSDAMFHSASIQQIQDFVHNGSGANCATVSNLGNRNPTVDAGGDYTIPAGTPFILTGSASDPDSGDSLTYSWEQFNAGTASNVDVDTGNNALIRGYLPVSSPERTIPPIDSLISGNFARGEVLPSTSRFLNFRLQVRDGEGGTAYDSMQITVQDTGSAFAVTQPSGTSLPAGESITVEWNVADTNNAPIFCNAVDIDITTNGGDSFQNLVQDITNDGSATVRLPSSLGEQNHIRVKCRDNIFFALSAANGINADTGNSSNDGGGGHMHWLLLVGLLAGYFARRPGIAK